MPMTGADDRDLFVDCDRDLDKFFSPVTCENTAILRRIFSSSFFVTIYSEEEYFALHR